MMGTASFSIVLVLIHGLVAGQLVGTKYPFVRVVEQNRNAIECDTAETGNKFEYVKLELLEANRKLKDLETANKEIHTALEDLRGENGRLQALESAYKEVHTALEEIRGAHGKLQSCENSTIEIRTVVKEIQQGNERLQVLENANGEVRLALKELQEGNRKNGEDVRLALKEILEEMGKRAVEKDRLQAIETDSQGVRTVLNEMKEQILNLSSPTSSNVILRSCKEILEEDKTSKSGVYRIQPKYSQESFMVLCDMEKKGGGWTYIHNRYDGSQEFYLGRQSYIKGFGNLSGEFWLGLEHIYSLTRDGTNELLVELVESNGVQSYAHYTDFSIGSNSEGYALKKLGKYIGTAGDSLTYHIGCKFSTKDLDLDKGVNECSKLYRGAWWYKDCYRSNLNGMYVAPGTINSLGMTWIDLRNFQSLKAAKMLIRQV